MLTVKQVKDYSEVSLRREPLSDLDGIKLYNGETAMLPGYTKSMARLLYSHSGRVHKMRIICPLSQTIPSLELREQTEEDIKATIDWKRFTRWINGHDDLEEYNLITPKMYSFYQLRSWKQGRKGRDVILDTTKKEVVDCNNIVLV